MSNKLMKQRYEVLCEAIEQASKGADIWEVNLFVLQSALLKHCNYFKSKQVIRQFIADLEVYQAADEMIGAWMVTSEIQTVARMKGNRYRVYTFRRT